MDFWTLLWIFIEILWDYFGIKAYFSCVLRTLKRQRNHIMILRNPTIIIINDYYGISNDFFRFLEELLMIPWEFYGFMADFLNPKHWKSSNKISLGVSLSTDSLIFLRDLCCFHWNHSAFFPVFQRFVLLESRGTESRNLGKSSAQP